ncbi:DUF4181 domain-containing protein [Halalkalibacter alkalisediminis]|uniref:DUF4181 domain-containing protein n=1 Tax=Halalkalibacter alkalisediminis TaxID=935616 RepID=A0ABV6NN56_9BACI|nr:DUF4181 domain-containing protein [Halalkalibacter alkalisediminis]
MFLIKMIVYIILAFIVAKNVDQWARKILKVEKTPDSKSTKYLKNRFDNILTFVFVIGVYLAIDYNPTLVFWVVLMWCASLFGVTAYMEWRFFKKSNEYKVTIIMGVYAALVICIGLTLGIFGFAPIAE